MVVQLQIPVSIETDKEEENENENEKKPDMVKTENGSSKQVIFSTNEIVRKMWVTHSLTCLLSQKCFSFRILCWLFAVLQINISTLVSND